MAVVDAPATASERRPPTPPAAELPRRRRVRAVRSELVAVPAALLELGGRRYDLQGTSSALQALAVP
jgi:hypothetical protein